MDRSWAPPAPIDPGLPPVRDDGVWDGRERRANADHDREPNATRSTSPRQAAKGAAKRADGALRVAGALDTVTANGAVVLHDRDVPNARGNIDHLVIARTGVWIIATKSWEGRVERRTGLRPSQPLLFVKGHDRTGLVEDLDWQIRAVRAAIAPIGFEEAPITGVLCFTGSHRGWFAKPLNVRGVLVTWPDKLAAAIDGAGGTDAATINLVAQQLSSKLPAVR